MIFDTWYIYFVYLEFVYKIQATFKNILNVFQIIINNNILTKKLHYILHSVT